MAQESNEKPPVVGRPTWDTDWNEISKQYALKIGDKYHATVNGVTQEKTASVLPYFEENFASGRTTTLDSSHRFEELKNVYRRCAIHNTDIKTNGVSAFEQARTVRTTELNGPQKFNDIGYHFLVASDGTIMEGRPCGRVGSNAGQTKEANMYAKKYLPNGIADITNATGATYYQNLQHYIQGMKMDPDYGTLGIAMCGDFDTGSEPSQQQKDSLVKILNWVKGEYDIPTNNIIYHREVKNKVIEASGLTFEGNYKETICPGSSFPAISNFTNKLKPDTQNAKRKTILLDKFS